LLRIYFLRDLKRSTLKVFSSIQSGEKVTYDYRQSKTEVRWCNKSIKGIILILDIKMISSKCNCFILSEMSTCSLKIILIETACKFYYFPKQLHPSFVTLEPYISITISRLIKIRRWLTRNSDFFKNILGFNAKSVRM
jgi:hypothetical protein